MIGDLTRRRFLRCTAQLGAVAGLSAVGCAWGGTRAGFLQRYPGFLGEAPHARALGSAYLDAYPADRNESVLMSALFGSLPKPWQTYSKAELRLFLSEQARSEFANGDVVRVRSWVVARSEARLMALYAL